MRKALLISILAAGTAQAAPNYTFTDLNKPGEFGSTAYSINDSGKVALEQLVLVPHGDYSTVESKAAFWENGNVTLAEGFSTYNSYGSYALNNAGDMIINNNGLPEYSLWSTSSGQVTQINNASYMYGINDNGQILGSSGHSALWNNPNSDPVDISNNNTFFGTALNNNGQIAGSLLVDGNRHAVIKTGDTFNDIGTLGGNNSDIKDLSNSGYAIGTSDIANGQTRSFLYHDGHMNQLGYIPGGIGQIWVNAVNDLGQSVGSLAFGETPRDMEFHAVLWNGTKAVDLNTYLDADHKAAGWVLQEANDINDHEWIVGTAHNTMTNQDHAFMLSGETVSPVPEPSTYAMLLVGLALTGFMVRRRG